MKLSDLANPRIPAVSPDATVEQAQFTMATSSADFIFVISNERPVGIISREELARKARSAPPKGRLLVRDFLGENPLWFYGDWDAEDAVKVMSEHQARKAIIRDRNGRLLGCVDFESLAAIPASKLPAPDEYDTGFVELL